jgi:hypothetical protein
MPGVSTSSLMLQPSKTNTRHGRQHSTEHVRPVRSHVAGGTFEFRRLDMFDLELSTWHHHQSSADCTLAMEEGVAQVLQHERGLQAKISRAFSLATGDLPHAAPEYQEGVRSGWYAGSPRLRRHFAVLVVDAEFNRLSMHASAVSTPACSLLSQTCL